jgi:hypothetical protein
VERIVRNLEKLVERLLWRLPKDRIDLHLEIPVPLTSESMAGARLFANREEMLSVVPKGGAIAEVGVWRGGFSRSICDVCQPHIFHLIDISFEPFDWTAVNCNFVKHEGDSSTILNEFPKGSLDWIYIDGDHSYEGVRKDINAAHQALKPGGIMTFNDYTNWCSYAIAPYGVARAVNEFILAEGYAIEGLALSVQGAHDLLVRKPQTPHRSPERDQ